MPFTNDKQRKGFFSRLFSRKHYKEGLPPPPVLTKEEEARIKRWEDDRLADRTLTDEQKEDITRAANDLENDLRVQKELDMIEGNDRNMARKEIDRYRARKEIMRYKEVHK
jgi:hypothetical protein